MHSFWSRQYTVIKPTPHMLALLVVHESQSKTAPSKKSFIAPVRQNKTVPFVHSLASLFKSKFEFDWLKVT